MLEQGPIFAKLCFQGECWYGTVALLFRMYMPRDGVALVECCCAMIETLWDYCRTSVASVTQIGTKMLYLLKPSSRASVQRAGTPASDAFW